MSNRKSKKRAYYGRVFQREGVFICGDYLDGDLYPVFQAPGKRRKKCKSANHIQNKLNQKNAERKLTRLVHANFTADDIALHLTYADCPENEECATKDLKNFLRRLKRRYIKSGLTLKYITCTEYGTRSGRAHHHLIINGGIDRDEIEKLWGLGYANSKRLQFNDEGITGLAKYMSKSHVFYRRWNSSRNLIRPECIISDGDFSACDLKELALSVEDGSAADIIESRYPDFIVTNIEAYKNPMNQGYYIHFEMRKRKRWERRQ